MAYEDHKRESEEVSLPVKRYKVDGYPVCASWYGKNAEICNFLGSKSFGSKRVCMITGDRVFDMYEDLQGFATPCQGCQVWDYEKEVKPVIDKLRT